MSDGTQDPSAAAAELRKLREELAESEALGGTLSHELRSPIGALLIFSSLLSRQHGSGLDESGRDLLQRLDDCARSTVALMDRFTLWSGLSHAAFEPVALDLSGEVRAVFADVLARHGGTPPALEVRRLPEVVADPALLRLLLGNLLENALKATAGRPEARIEVGGERDATEVHIVVRDNGIGFDPTQSARLFQPFGRLHPQAAFPGVGLGLAIVRRVARWHGGRAWAEALPGRGATLHVALPQPSGQVASASRPAE